MIEAQKKITLRRRIQYGWIPAALGMLGALIFQNPLPLMVGAMFGWILAHSGDQIHTFLVQQELLPIRRVRDITAEVRGEHRRVAAPAPAPVEDETEDAVLVEEEDVVLQLSPPAPEKVIALPAPEAAKLEATWESLIGAGFLRPGADYALAVTEAGSVLRMPNLTSMGVGGAPGSGKTVSMVSLIMQTVAKYDGKVKFLVVDPHMESGSEDALVSRLLPALQPLLFNQREVGENPVAGGEDLLRWITYLEAGVRQRISGTDIFNGDFIVLLIDEFASLLDDEQVARPLLTLIDLINSQARKVKAFALVASPHWKATRVPTDLRATLPSFLIHQMPPSIAQQIVPTEIAQKANKLGVGQLIAFTRGMYDIGYAPLTEQGMLKAVVKRFAGAANAELPSPVVLGDEPTFTQVIHINRGYQSLMALQNTEAAAVDMLALHTFGVVSATTRAMVDRALKLAEEHGVVA